jgi:hypothetical protein
LLASVAVTGCSSNVKAPAECSRADIY